MNAKILNILLWIAVTFWLVMMLNSLTTSEQIEARNLSYSQFLQELSSGAVKEVTIQDETIKGMRSDGSRFETYDPGDPGLVGDLLKNDVVIRAKPPEQPSVFMQLVAAWLPFIVLAGIWIWFMRRSAGGGSGGLFQLRQEPRASARRGRGARDPA